MVSVICCSIREHFMENVFQNYDNQTIKKKELIIILNREEMDDAKWRARAARSKDVLVYKMPGFTLGECLNYGISKSRYKIIAKCDDDDYYAPDYLAEQVNTLRHTDADLVCKITVFMYFEENKTLAIHLPHMEAENFIQKHRGVKGATLVFRKKLWKHVKFHPINKGEDSMFIKQCLDEQYKVFTTNRYNYVCIRRSENLHTWKRKNAKLMKQSKLLRVTEEYRRAVEKGPK